MKHKKFIIFFITIIFVFVIYRLNYEPKLTYLALGDDLALGKTPFNEVNNSYADYLFLYMSQTHNVNTNFKKTTKEDYRITDLIKDINNVNFSNEKYTITYLIKEADLITISIGSEELFTYLLKNQEQIKNGKTDNIYKFIDEMFIDLELLTYKLKGLTKKPIIFIGYYNPLISSSEILNNIFISIETKFKLLEEDNIYYVSIYEEFIKKSFYLPNSKSNFPSLEGYNYISNEIIKEIQNNKII